MSSPNLWLSIEPRSNETRLMLSSTTTGPSLKAMLPTFPADPRSLSLLLDALCGWYGMPLCAVLDADALDVKQNPGRWALLLGDLKSPHIEVEWAVSPIARRRRRDLDGVGDFRRARRIVTNAATGLS